MTTKAESKFAHAGASAALLGGMTGLLILGSWVIGPPAVAQEQTAAANPAATASGGGWEVPSLEQSLERAMIAHPEIVVARSKVQQAEAELRLTRFQVSREIVTLWNEWSQQHRVVSDVKARHPPPQAEMLEFLIGAQANLTAMESQLRNLVGETGYGRVDGNSVGRLPVPPRLPRGPSVEQIRAALDHSIPLDFVNVPLKEVTEYVKEFLRSEMKIVRIEIVVDENLGDLPITLTLEGTPLGAVIQAIEDQSPQISFVVRDYGILVTTKDSPADLDGISAVDFWRETLSGRPDAPKSNHGKETVGK